MLSLVDERSEQWAACMPHRAAVVGMAALVSYMECLPQRPEKASRFRSGGTSRFSLLLICSRRRSGPAHAQPDRDGVRGPSHEAACRIETTCCASRTCLSAQVDEDMRRSYVSINPPLQQTVHSKVETWSRWHKLTLTNQSSKAKKPWTTSRFTRAYLT